MKPRTLKRKDRLRQAGRWIADYTGKNLIKGYSKRFRVDLLCAAYDLRMLGVEIPESRIQQLKKDLENRIKQNECRRQLKEQQFQVIESDPCSKEYFYYIAGYTSSGVPFGVTREEVDQ